MTTTRARCPLPTWDEDALFPNDFSRLDLIADEPGPLKDEERYGIINAIRSAASDGGGCFTADTVRPYLPEKHNPHRVGPITSGFVSRGIVRDTGRTAKSGDRRNRNGNRNMPVYEVIDWEGLQ